MSWQNFSSTQLNQEYSPSTCVDDITVYLDAYRNDSKQVLEQGLVQRNLVYASGPHRLLDYFAATSQGPLVIFIHGGYWQQLSKEDSCFVAADLVAQGFHYAAIDYPLAPGATISEIIDCCCQAVVWLQQQSDRLDFDPQRIFLAGSSAGAHLCSSVLLAACREQRGLMPETIAGALLLSGIYDLQPLIHTYINDALQLDKVSAALLSPALQELQGLPPCFLCWGENETSEFKRQSQQFSQLLQASQVVSECFEITDRNHFDLVYELGLPDSPLCQALKRLAQ